MWKSNGRLRRERGDLHKSAVRACNSRVKNRIFPGTIAGASTEQKGERKVHLLDTSRADSDAVCAIAEGIVPVDARPFGIWYSCRFGLVL